MGISAYARWEDAFRRATCCAECGEDLGEGDDSLCMEAFDLTSGEIVCDACAEQIVEANSQFGVGA